ncbi:MAG: ACT domain-containing protein [Verrucomicrobiota bacterium]
MKPKLTLRVLPHELAICRMDSQSPIPEWAQKSPFFSITRTRTELSIVSEPGYQPVDSQSERGWNALAIVGPLEFDLTGILASLATPLAAVEIPIFVISTFDTDIILVKNEQLDTACQTLRTSGHTIIH